MEQIFSIIRADMHNFNPVTQDQPVSDPEFRPGILPVIFYSGGSKIVGTMLLAGGKGPHPVVMLLHGFPGNEVNFDLAHSIRRQGYNVFIFHYRGSWGSEGDYSWSNTLEDVEAAIQFLKEKDTADKYRTDGSRIILLGHSMGGFAALYNCVRHDEIKNAGFLAGFNAGFFGEYLVNHPEIKDYTLEHMQYAIPFIKNADAGFLMNEMIENRKDWNLLNHIGRLAGKNLLLIGASFDATAPAELHHNPLAAALNSVNGSRTRSELLISGHSFSDKRIELASIVSEWLNGIEF